MKTTNGYSIASNRPTRTSCSDGNCCRCEHRCWNVWRRRAQKNTRGSNLKPNANNAKALISETCALPARYRRCIALFVDCRLKVSSVDISDIFNQLVVVCFKYDLGVLCYSIRRAGLRVFVLRTRRSFGAHEKMVRNGIVLSARMQVPVFDECRINVELTSRYYFSFG